MIQQIGPFFGVRSVFQQIFHQKYFIAGGGHFRHEYLIMGVKIGLCGIGIVGMKSVTHFVGEGKHIVQGVIVIHQYIGMCAVNTGGVGAASFSLVFIHIDPTVVKSFLQQADIVFPKGGKGFQDGLLGFLKADFPACIGNNGCIDIVHVQFVHAKESLAQTDIAIHFVKIGIDGSQQVIVYIGGDIVVADGCLQGGRIFAGFGIKHQLLHLTAVETGQGILELLIGLIHFIKGFFPHAAVGGLQQRAVPAMGDADGLSLFICHLRQLQVGIVKYGEGLVGNAGHFLRHGQQALHFRGQAVGLQPLNFLNVFAVCFQAGLCGIEAFQGLLVDGKDFRICKSQFAVHVGISTVELQHHGLICSIAQVLVTEPLGITGYGAGFFLHLF